VSSQLAPAQAAHQCSLAALLPASANQLPTNQHAHPLHMSALPRPALPTCDLCLPAGVESIEPLEARLKEAGVEYTRSMSGRPAIFFRDPGGWVGGRLGGSQRDAVEC
jgi:hypothetical protein